MENGERICAIASPRPEGASFEADDGQPEATELKIRVCEEILKKITDGCTCFMTGCARGMDILCGEWILNMKMGDPRIRLTCVVPAAGQADSWAPQWRARRSRMLKLADRVVIMNPGDVQAHPDQCGRYMAEHSSELIAICGGGLPRAMDFARGLPVACVDPSAART